MEKIVQKVKKQKMDERICPNNSKKPSLLSKTLMTLDGFLLSTFSNMGSCIPDKLVTKEELIKELSDEINEYGKSAKKNEKEITLGFRRRTATISEFKTSESRTKEICRRSWGPDNTWSSQFVSVNSFTNTKCKEINTYNKSDTTISNNQNYKKIINFKPKEVLEKRKKDVMKMFSWQIGESLDYVHTEKAESLVDVETILDVMLTSTIPIQVTFKVNSSIDISITYQFLPKFKDEYMVLKISRTHCMVMRAF
ncbi:uncharacterized protein LOC100209369 isoform X1 [Hydra vulgaris]